MNRRPTLQALIAIPLFVLMLPVMALVAALVWAGVGWPVLFRQHRAGLSGAPFELVKFRTMLDTRDCSGMPLPDDQRLTRIGRLLRRSRLDELPELYNIVRGEMAFIGPRPLLPHTIADAGRDGERRGTVRPGLTGWSQVNGNTLLSMNEKLGLDLWYVDNRSARLDAEILMRTLFVCLIGERRKAG